MLSCSYLGVYFFIQTYLQEVYHTHRGPHTRWGGGGGRRQWIVVAAGERVATAGGFMGGMQWATSNRDVYRLAERARTTTRALPHHATARAMALLRYVCLASLLRRFGIISRYLISIFTLYALAPLHASTPAYHHLPPHAAIHRYHAISHNTLPSTASFLRDTFRAYAARMHMRCIANIRGDAHAARMTRVSLRPAWRILRA